MGFTFIEMEGDKPVSDWLMRKIKQYISEHSGLDVLIEIHPQPEEIKDSAAEVNSNANR